MYNNVDAVTDLPACCFWDQLHEAFPDSKIIPTTKESEKAWLEFQYSELNSLPVRVMGQLSPTARKLDHHMMLITIAVFGYRPKKTWIGGAAFNRSQCRRAYMRHNAHVVQNAPEDKLLVYSVKDGWKPLCEFLGKEVPDKPFPHENKRGTKVTELAKDQPTFVQIARESLVSLGVIICATSFLSYKVYAAESIGQLLSECITSVTSLVRALWKSIT